MNSDSFHHYSLNASIYRTNLIKLLAGTGQYGISIGSRELSPIIASISEKETLRVPHTFHFSL